MLIECLGSGEDNVGLSYICSFSYVVAADLSEGQATSAVEMLIECLGSGEDNVELIEQICFALNVYITANGKRYAI